MLNSGNEDGVDGERERERERERVIDGHPSASTAK